MYVGHWVCSSLCYVLYLSLSATYLVCFMCCNSPHIMYIMYNTTPPKKAHKHLQYLWTKWQFVVTCSRTINSNLCDSNFSIATFPMISAAPFNGKRWRLCTILFYFKSGINGKTQPWYWLATNNKTTKKEKHGENRMPVLVAKNSILHPNNS